MLGLKLNPYEGYQAATALYQSRPDKTVPAMNDEVCVIRNNSKL